MMQQKIKVGLRSVETVKVELCSVEVDSLESASSLLVVESRT